MDISIQQGAPGSALEQAAMESIANDPTYKASDEWSSVPFPVAAYGDEVVLSPDQLHIDVWTGPGLEELRLFRLLPQASVYLQQQFLSILENVQTTQILPYNGGPEMGLPPGVYSCHTINPEANLVNWTDPGYPRLRGNTGYYNDHLQPMVNQPNGCFHAFAAIPDGNIPSLNIQTMAARLVYARRFCLFAAHQGVPPLEGPAGPVPQWYWPVQWTSRGNHQHECDTSHLCHNKHCVTPEHIVVEPSRTNRNRQYGLARCPGYLIRKRDYADTDNVEVLGYQCTHTWGCRVCTAVNPFGHAEGESTAWTQLVYRSGHQGLFNFGPVAPLV